MVAPACAPDAGRAASDAAAAPLATPAAAGVHRDVRLRPCAVVHAAATQARVARAASERIVAPTTPPGVVIAAAIAVAGAMERAVGGAARLWAARRTGSSVVRFAPGGAPLRAALRLGVFLDDARRLGVDPAMPGSPATWSAVLVPDPDAPPAAALADAIGAPERAASIPLR